MKNLNLLVAHICLPFTFLGQEFEILKHEKPILIQELKQLNSPSRECNLIILPNSK